MKPTLLCFLPALALWALPLSETHAAEAKEVAVIKTSAGDMVVEFWPEVAPKSVENFKRLAKEKFYDGSAFHRIIKDFMIQGGDPKSKDPTKEREWGTGDSGTRLKAEFNDRKHEVGVISMARASDPDSASCQFFICLSPSDSPQMQSLNGKYTAFGKLTKGEDVLKKLGTVPTGPSDRPVDRANIESIKVVPADSVK